MLVLIVFALFVLAAGIWWYTDRKIRRGHVVQPILNDYEELVSRLSHRP